MKIVWNRVTPLSKFFALVLFVLLPFIGFWLGTQYGKALSLINGTPGTSNYYQSVASWQKDSNDPDFSISYPIDFEYQDNYTGQPTTDWRVGASAGELGVNAFTLAIPRSFEPQTNFADAKLTVGHSENSAAVEHCMKQDQSGSTATPASTASINGTAFTVFHSSGAGAGNFYETTSYRTLHAGGCWAIEYTIHSTQIGNYPASYGLQPFNKTNVTDLLDRIVGTFNFT